MFDDYLEKCLSTRMPFTMLFGLYANNVCVIWTIYVIKITPYLLQTENQLYVGEVSGENEISMKIWKKDQCRFKDS